MLSDATGYEKETNHDAVMERVDAEGHVIGISISIMDVSKFSRDKPLKADLVSSRAMYSASTLSLPALYLRQLQNCH